MWNETNEFVKYVLDTGEELFGDEFEYEKCSYTMHDGYHLRKLLDREEEPSFYIIRIHNMWKTHMNKGDISMLFYIMEGVHGPELLCDLESVLEEADIEELKKYTECSIGQRNGMFGWAGVYENAERKWQRIDYFRTREKECVKIFFEAILRYKQSEGVNFRWMVPEEFFPRMVAKIKNMNDVSGLWEDSYYFSYDSKNPLYYDCKVFIIRQLGTAIEIRRYPDKQELVSVEPTRNWAMIHDCVNEKKRIEYRNRVYELEWDLIEKMMETDRESILFSVVEEDRPRIHIGEFRTENVEIAEAFIDEVERCAHEIERYKRELCNSSLDDFYRERKWDY